MTGASGGAEQRRLEAAITCTISTATMHIGVFKECWRCKKPLGRTCVYNTTRLILAVKDMSSVVVMAAAAALIIFLLLSTQQGLFTCRSDRPCPHPTVLHHILNNQVKSTPWGPPVHNPWS